MTIVRINFGINWYWTFAKHSRSPAWSERPRHDETTMVTQRMYRYET